MNEAIMQMTIPFAIAAVVLFIIAGLIWLFACHGIDKIRHPEEWTDEGKSGEQIIYRQKCFHRVYPIQTMAELMPHPFL